jgi:hypothetical protein
MADDSHIQPRLLSGNAAAAYCDVTAATFSKWVSTGIMPKPVIGRRWDRKAIDLALDKLSGIESSPPKNAWKRQYDARMAEEKSAEETWERKYEARKRR